MSKKQLNDVLLEITKYPDLSCTEEYIKKEILQGFIEVYSDKEFRHSYYELSTFIEASGSDERDSLESNLEFILKYADDQKINTDIIKKLLKLLDHVSLERLRLSRMDKISFIGKKVSEDMEDTKSAIQNKQLEINEIEQQIKHVHTETITILGIFAGLVIGFATSFQLLAKSFENLNEIFFYKEIAYLSVIGIILFDSIFLLLFSVARISKRSLAINCKYEDCTNCHKRKPCNLNLKKICIKYPYVFWYNLILLLVIIICVAFEIYKHMNLIQT